MSMAVLKADKYFELYNMNFKVWFDKNRALKYR